MSLTDIEGIQVGHAHDLQAGLTGCSVVLCPPHTVGGIDQRGGAPGTRESDALRPMRLVQQVDAIFLAGGSAYGLSVGDGVMRYMEEQGRGYETPAGRVPIVAGAILYDLDMGDAKIRPTADMGYQACTLASTEAVAMGSIGAGTGAKVGGMLGKESATKGGIGTASITLDDGLIVSAMIAVNAAGDVLDERNEILAGMHQNGDFIDSLAFIRKMPPPDNTNNTVIGVVATNAKLNKEEVNKMAQMAQDGIARAIRPAHTPYDGDTLFGLATGAKPANLLVVGAYAAEVTAQAIRQGIRHATSLGGVPAMTDLR